MVQVRSPGVCFYVLRDSAGLYLLDGGFIGGRRFLTQALRLHGWENEPIRGIILTHGHLDHIFNVAALARDSGAWVAAPRLDQLHCEGRFPYRGIPRICGVLETGGRRLLGFEDFAVTRWFDDLAEFPIGPGLTAIHLPGHTDGHMGLYCEARKLLFCADLFASFSWISHYPPNFLNTHAEQIPASVAKALSLDLEGILPNHCDTATPAEHLRRLRILQMKKSPISKN